MKVRKQWLTLSAEIARKYGMIAVVLWSVFGTCWATAGGMLEFLQQRRHRQYDRVPREVLAFYYTWYGRPERHGRWVHWRDVDEARHDIGSSRHFPAKGAYDSHDPKIIDWQIDLAKSCGVTGFIATWWGQGTFTDRALERVIERANAKDFHVTIYWETAPGEGDRQINRAVADLVYILRKYGSQPSFLKVDGKPVIFVYGRVMHQVPLEAWPEIIQRTQAEYGRDFLLIADGYQQWYARMFDGVHTYNIASKIAGKAPEEIRRVATAAFHQAVQLARQYRRISCLTVIPGYDDTKVRQPGLVVSRHDGQTYEVLWEEAIRADPDWILITSWNEWHEGSELEPGLELGDRYIRLTSKWTQRFLAAPTSRSATDHAIDSATDSTIANLRRRFQNKPIGILPGYSGDIVWWLMDHRLPVQELTWQDVVNASVVNPKRLPVLVLAGDEHYVSTVRETNDVIKALQRYLRGGGLLVAISSAPHPLYYDESGQVHVVSRQLGLPIAQGWVPNKRNARPAGPFSWESPPEGALLTFHANRNYLPALPPHVPFPSDGDRRWRAAWRDVIPPGNRYLPLVTLKDDTGGDYGDGIAFVEYREGPLAGGKTLYVWMRMPDIYGAEKLFPALFRLIDKQTRAIAD